MAFVDYIQDNDPGSVGAGMVWLRDSGDLFVRNGFNSRWTRIGNINFPKFGWFPINGSSSPTGAITGNHGLLPITDANITGTGQFAGNNIATVSYLNDLCEENGDIQDTVINEELAVTYSTYKVRDKFAISFRSQFAKTIDTDPDPGYSLFGSNPYYTKSDFTPLQKAPDSDIRSYGMSILELEPKVWFDTEHAGIGGQRLESILQWFNTVAPHARFRWAVVDYHDEQPQYYKPIRTQEIMIAMR